jgi:peptide/nickel transport system substrate-binding protein
MRRALPLILAIGIVAAACTPSGDDGAAGVSDGSGGSATSTTTVDSTSSTLPPDGFGGELVVGVDSFGLSTLNPFDPEAFGTTIAGNAIWATVYDIDPVTWERIPDAVTALPSASGSIEVGDDGTMTVRYEVRRGAMWSDGTPITGEDVAFTAEAMRDMAQAGEGNVDPVMATVVGTDAVEQLGFITFSEPTLAFEDAFWIILPRHVLEGVDLVDGTDGGDWPSGGPFVVDTFDPGSEVRLVRNDAYGRADDAGRALPYLDAITFRATTDDGGPASPVSAFVGRSLDVTTVPPNDGEIARLDPAVEEGAVVEAVPTPIVEQLTFQFGEGRAYVNEGSLNDASSYRQAVAHLLDREALLDATGVPWMADPPGLLVPFGESAWSRYDLDPSTARDLVDEAAGDAPGGPEARLSTTGNGDYRIRIGDALAESFDDAGVDYAPIYLDSVLFFGDTLTEGSFDVGMWAWVSDGGFAGSLLMLEQYDPRSVPPDGNYGRWDGGEVADRYAEIVDEARSTVDAEAFRSLIAEAEAVLADEVVVIPLFRRAAFTAWWPDVATGIIPNGSRSDLTWNVEDWQRVGE